MRPIEVIAEIGVNWNGEMRMAEMMIRAAKECGADTAKFQIYDPETTLDRDDPVLSPWWDIIMETKLDFEDVEFLKSWCQKEGIGFLASAFDVERVGWLTELDVERYKIAARSVYDGALVRAIGLTGKPVLISLSEKYNAGWPDATSTEIPRSIPKKYLYCVSEYPTPLAHVGFHRGLFIQYDGFSDHTQGITASVMAMSLGAKIIEKHFTMDKSLPGPDHICSADPDELRQLCQMRDDIEEILYHGD
jgi:N-acetylneuraminate synthase/N,N'-diacetyllegionaminate synthase